MFGFLRQHFRKRPVAPKDLRQGPYQHRLASFADVNGGAEEFVFEQPTTNPLYSYRGSGRLAGQFLPFGEVPPTISLHPTGAPQGLPIQTSDIRIQASNEIDDTGTYVETNSGQSESA